LVVAGRRDWRDAIALGNIAVAGVVRGIKALGLEMAPRKTEAVFFHDGSRGPPPRLTFVVDGHDVQVGTRMKYLGLHLDGRWTFEKQFAQLASRMGGVSASLARLLPNLGVRTAVSAGYMWAGSDRWPFTGLRSGRMLPRCPTGSGACCGGCIVP